MSLWNRNKPLSQPPHFRSGQDTKTPVDQVAKEAIQALKRCRNEAQQPTEPESRLMRRLARFIQSCIRLRSIRLALWVREYDLHNPKH